MGSARDTMDSISHVDNSDGGIHRVESNRSHTTMDSWREARNSLHAAAGIGFRFLAPSPQFDPEVCLDEDRSIRTRASISKGHRRESSVHSTGTRLSQSWLAVERTQTRENNDHHHTISEIHDDKAGEAKSAPETTIEDKSPPVTGSEQIHPQQCIESPWTTRPPTPAADEGPYHVFGKSQKWLVVITIGMAGLFSGLSSNIYFPSLNAIAADLNVSLSSVNLTITSYLVVQGISPLIWGSLSDALGRRPIYIASFTVYIISNIALSFSPNFPVLLVFRAIQAAGSASTVSIGNGVIQDVSPPSERGAFISFYQAIRNFSIAIGPVLGGILANFLGFRSIFVFLLILSALVLIVIVFFLPETMRSITGNGSVRVGGIYQPLIYRIKGEPSYLEEPSEPIVRKKITIQTFVDPLKLLVQKDILLNLVFGGVIYTIWSMVTSSTTGLFKDTFGLSELTLGLAYLPNGLGTIVGSAIVGRLMTRDYKSTEERYKATHNLPAEFKLSPKKVPNDFPIERARLRHLPWIAGLFVLSTGGYGFTLVDPKITSLNGWIAVPLFLQFMIAATSNAVFAVNQTLVSDLCPGKGASATAMNNLVRCGLGAVGVAFIDQMIAALGASVAFLVLALVVVLCSPLAAANLMFGMQWRAERINAKEKAQSEKNRNFMNV